MFDFSQLLPVFLVSINFNHNNHRLVNHGTFIKQCSQVSARSSSIKEVWCRASNSPSHGKKTPNKINTATVYLHLNSFLFACFCATHVFITLAGTSLSADDATSCLTATFWTANSERPYWSAGNTGGGSLEGS